MKKNFWDVLLANYYYWPIVNYFNFKYVPLHLRMAGVNLSSLFWNVYLALKNQNSKALKHEIAPAIN